MSVLKSESFGKSDIGGRSNNEDAFAIHRANKLLLVADGMGGHVDGEMASATACQSLATSAATAPASFDSTTLARAWMEQALQEAHQSVLKLNGSSSGLGRMGTTATLAMVEGNKLLVAWAGDSRVYRLRGSTFDLVNDDHVLKYEVWRAGQMTAADYHSYRRGQTSNVITRSLGCIGCLDVDFREVDIAAGDVILVCSDGLNNALSDGQMVKVLTSRASVKQIASDLIAAALAANARDNVTAVVSVIS